MLQAMLLTADPAEVKSPGRAAILLRISLLMPRPVCVSCRLVLLGASCPQKHASCFARWALQAEP